jgi:hypothetical protein
MNSRSVEKDNHPKFGHILYFEPFNIKHADKYLRGFLSRVADPDPALFWKAVFGSALKSRALAAQTEPWTLGGSKWSP